MIIKALNTFSGILDLSALERLQESNPYEKGNFRHYIRPGETIEVDDTCYTLTSVQNALRLGYIQIGDMPDVPSLNYKLVDPSYFGITLSKTAGENLIAGNLVYFRNDGKVYKAKADSTVTMICIGIVTTTVNIDNSVTLLVDGLIRNSTVFSFTAGGQASSPTAIVYASDITSGLPTQTRPNASGHIVQIIGYAVTTDVLRFKLDYTYIELK